jgi:hypothetical protein
MILLKGLLILWCIALVLAGLAYGLVGWIKVMLYIPTIFFGGSK